MRNLIAAVSTLFVVSVFWAAESLGSDQVPLNGSNGYSDFIPQDPKRSPTVTYYDETGTNVTKAWSVLSNAVIVRLLSNTHAEITVGKFDASGGVTYLVAKVSGKEGTYKVIMDYCDYINEDVKNDSGKVIGQGRVGVGLRLTAIVTTTSADVNLGSLFAIGVAANLNRLSGSMTVDSIGIRIAGNAGPILSSTTIDESSIQKVLETIAVIQSKIADPTTTLDPQLLSVKPTAQNVTPADIASKLL